MSSPRAAAQIAFVLALAVATAVAGDDPAKDAPKDPPKPVEPCTRLTGVVVDREGKPIAKAWVEIRDHRGWMLPNRPEHVVTGDDGRFVYEGLTAGEKFRIRAVAEGCAWGTAEPTAPAKEEVRIVLVPAKTLAGRVVDADAKPLADVKVTLRLVEASIPIRDDTDADGLFALRPVGTSSGELVAVWREVVDHVCLRKRVVRRAASAKDAGLTIAFTKGLAIAGTSVAVDGKWVRRIGVQAIPVARTKEDGVRGDDWCAGRFDKDGAFRIEGLEKGRYRLVGWWGDANSWSGPPAAEVSGTVEVEAGTTDVALKLVQPR
jgi:hypothetical protein